MSEKKLNFTAHDVNNYVLSVNATNETALAYHDKYMTQCLIDDINNNPIDFMRGCLIHCFQLCKKEKMYDDFTCDSFLNAEYIMITFNLTDGTVKKARVWMK